MRQAIALLKGERPGSPLIAGSSADETALRSCGRFIGGVGTARLAREGVGFNGRFVARMSSAAERMLCLRDVLAFRPIAIQSGLVNPGRFRLFAFSSWSAASILALAVLPACGRSADPRLETIAVGALEREFLLHVPDGLPDAPLPLVFVFHGGNGHAVGTMNLTRFNEVADREKFLVVYPQGVGRSWNDGRVTEVTQAHREGVDELAFFDSLLAHLSERHPVDARRVHATGISNGAIFSHYLAAKRAGKVASIAPVVGGIADPFHERFDPAQPVSVLIVQGTADPLVPYEGGKIAGPDGKNRGGIIATDEAVRLWTRANGCSPEPEVAWLPDRDPGDGCRTESRTWSGGRDGTEVVLWRIEGGGHTWPGGLQYLPARIIGPVTRDFGSQEIWEFFERNPKRPPGEQGGSP